MCSLSTEVVETRGLTKRFGSIVAVDGIDLSVHRGEIFGLLGPNGSGKTTTVRMLCGLMTPTAGSALVCGFDVGAKPERVKERIGYMPQRFCLYDALTVRENLDFLAGVYGVPRRNRTGRISDVLELVRLPEAADRLLGQLSGGMKQRISLAAALIHEPELLLLDEPTAGVDPPLRRIFWAYFRELIERGVSIFLNTHYMDEAGLCDRLAIMSLGRIVAVGSPRELRREIAGGDLVEAVCTDPQKAATLTRDVKGVLRVELKDNILAVLVEDAAVDTPLIVTTLEKAGIRLLEVRTREPSLEDVFVAAIAKEAD